MVLVELILQLVPAAIFVLKMATCSCRLASRPAPQGARQLPGFLHVLAALDEAAALVIVLRACDSLRVTLGVYLCGWPVCIRDVVRVNI